MSHTDADWFDPESPVLQAWKRAMDSMLSGDLALARDCFTEDALWYDTFVGTLRGAAVIAEHLAGMLGRDFDRSTIEVVRALADADTGAVEWVQKIHTGERSVTVEGTTWVTLSDGRLSRLWDYIQPLRNRKP
jgi:ketosteroid isomerase-like protein